MKVNPAVWRLQVSCDVQRISGTDEFDVHWFHKNKENITIDLGQVKVSKEAFDRKEVIFGMQLAGTYFDESMLGEYWCQVIITSMQPNVYLGKSDILMIRDPEDYDGELQRCQGIITVSTTKCADGIQSSLSVSPSSSCTNPTTTEGVQLSLTESTSFSSQHHITQQLMTTSLRENMSSSSQHIPSETNPITTEQVTLATSSSKVDSFSSSSDTSSPSSSPSPSADPSQLNSGDNTQLIIMAGSIGGAMFLLIILLLIIICVLICIKNGRKNNRKSGLYCTVLYI